MKAISDTSADSTETPAHSVGRDGGAVAESFESFFEVEHDRLFGALYLITGNRHEADDVMQEAFVRIWERWHLVQSLANPTGYLYRTALNVWRMRRRRAAVAARNVLRAGGQRDEFDEVDMREDVRRLLAALPRRQRAAIVLTELLGYPPSEAGEVLGIKPSTVRALTTQGRAALRKLMEVER